MSDSIEISGLTVLLEDLEEPAVLDLHLRCSGRALRASVLTAGGEWALNLRDEQGNALPHEGELYPSQEGAIVAALLMALAYGNELPLA